MRTRRSRGFTLIELLIVFFVIGILAVLSAGTFKSMREASALRIAQEETKSAFLSSRSRTLASEEDTTYGIRVTESRVIRFEGATYNASSTSNVAYIFENGVTATSSLLNSDIIFTRLTGESNASGTIFLRTSTMTATRTVSIRNSGLVE